MSNRLLTWRRLLLAVLVLLGISPNERADAAVFANYKLTEPCCGDDLLLGTRASIRTPVSATTILSTGCLLHRSVAQSDFGPFIQAGFLQCRGTTLDGTCGYGGQQVKYVEIRDAAGIFHCFPQGGIGNKVNALYSVTNTSGAARWRAYIDGINDGNFVDFPPPGDAQLMSEGAEWTSGCSDIFAQGAVSYGLSQPWQRWTGIAWVTVQSAFWTGNVCGFTFSGGPTGVWSISRQ